MRDVLDPLLAAWRAGETVGLATVVRTFDSAPRDPGAAMLVGADGATAGSVSGGCVEGAVYELAAEVVEGATPTLERYGISDDDAFAVGLTCGGVLDVFVEPVSAATFPQLGSVATDIAAGTPVAVVTVVEHVDPSVVGRRLIVREDRVDGTLGSPDADRRVAEDARGLLASGVSTALRLGVEGERLGDGMRVFVNSFAPRARLLVFGANDYAAALVRLGGLLAYEVTVCDARARFATRARFPDADEIIVRWPHEYLREQITAGRVDERTVICVLTHDPKFDVPLLAAALQGPDVAFVGAMGSRRTHVARIRALRAEGVPEDRLAGLQSPIGLDLGARTPAETAVSMAAQIIARRRGGSRVELSAATGPIHRRVRPSGDPMPLLP